MMNTSNLTCNPPYDHSAKFVIATYSIVFALGVPANCLTAWLTMLKIWRHNVLSVYLFSLSLSELMYLSTLPLWIIYIQNDHQWKYGSTACKITGYIFFINIYISILILCCISIDRFMGVVYSLESRGIRHQKTAKAVAGSIYLVVAVVHIPVFNMTDGETSRHTTCFETLPMLPIVASFNYARVMVGLVIPLMILIFTNFKITKIIRISSSLDEQQKAKVKHLAIAIITIFLICFAPYHVVLLVRAIVFSLYPNDTCWFEEKIYTISALFLCLTTVNGVADPFIYVLASENVRKGICKGLRKWRLQSSTT
ncbi:putative G-protein coupled receptor 132 [Microcaecilia unicolor]|uniref:Probable G-protein coupled receptor 132 n=1 Tax=Microcaecilia unicolor TaxID=1415580 RepID=A0A6P7Z681_9AMPH|nr:probable G-protein coupled receptor 132 [Microcaecilia unicolor]XP_030070916.1 probable G-protein coupled receptor 132 [Microcaecilia unicolor]